MRPWFGLKRRRTPLESRLEIEARASLAEPARGARATPDRSDLLIASARPAAKGRRGLLQFARAWPLPLRTSFQRGSPIPLRNLEARVLTWTVRTEVRRVEERTGGKVTSKRESHVHSYVGPRLSTDRWQATRGVGLPAWPANGSGDLTHSFRVRECLRMSWIVVSPWGPKGPHDESTVPKL